MNDTLKKALKIILPFGLGIFICWVIWNQLNEIPLDENGQPSGPAPLGEFLQALKEAHYGWIAFSLVFAVISHLSRAWRWKYMLEPLGHKPRFKSSFFAVMGGYLINMAIPRAGEAARATYLSRAEKIPFSQAFGSIAAERVVDLVVLMIIAGLTFFLQLELMGDFLDQMSAKLGEKLTTKNLIILAVGGLIAVVTVWFVIKKTPIGGKVKGFLKGLWDGLKTIFTMKKKWLFLLHTSIIWICYLVMFYVSFFAIDATSNLGLDTMFAAFVLGSVAIIVVPGGIGAYPVLIATAIALYDPGLYVAGIGLGWIIWASQTALNIIGGGIALMFAPKPIDKPDDNKPDNVNLQSAQA